MNRTKTSMPAWTVGLTLILATAAAATTPAAAPATYGAGVELAAATPIATLVADPDAWAGKTVRVEGRVVGVCAKKGCWMELESQDGDRVRIKVEDDVITFPAEAEGHWAVAQGTVEVREMSREQYAGWMRHLAEEGGKPFDEASLGDGPFRFVQIAGTGATIAD